MEKKYALVTGASSGIGRAIAHRLYKDGYTVYGLGRNFCEDEPFIKILCDFSKPSESWIPVIKKIQNEAPIQLLVLAAGTAYYGLHEEQSPKKIHEMLMVNVEAPMILTQLFLRDFKKSNGKIIFISSVTATHASPHACTYGATKAALCAFSNSLFEEARKYGVSVTSILPDMTQTNLYRNANFTAAKSEDARLTPEEVADAVMYAVSARNGLVMREITLRPQKNQILKIK